jgi:hypothetical protein
MTTCPVYGPNCSFGWNTTQALDGQNLNDFMDYELGLKFKNTGTSVLLGITWPEFDLTNGTINRTIRFWDPQVTGPIMSKTTSFDLVNPPNPVSLTAYFDSPFGLTPTKEYIVTYIMGNDTSSYAYKYFTFSPAHPFISGSLYALQGVYSTPPSNTAPPSSTFSNTNYFIDVLLCCISSCPPGLELDTNELCTIQCPIDSFNNGSFLTCQPCPPNTTNFALGSSTCILIVTPTPTPTPEPPASTTNNSTEELISPLPNAPVITVILVLFFLVFFIVILLAIFCNFRSLAIVGEYAYQNWDYRPLFYKGKKHS